MGRKPVNDVPMTPLERQRRHRAKRKQERTANAHRLQAYHMELRLRRALGDLRLLHKISVQQGLMPVWEGKVKLSARDHTRLIRMASSLMVSVVTIEALLTELDLWRPAKQLQGPHS